MSNNTNEVKARLQSLAEAECELAAEILDFYDAEPETATEQTIEPRPPERS